MPACASTDPTAPRPPFLIKRSEIAKWGKVIKTSDIKGE
jgi:hypothetical protein